MINISNYIRLPSGSYLLCLLLLVFKSRHDSIKLSNCALYINCLYLHTFTHSLSMYPFDVVPKNRVSIGNVPQF